MQFAAKNNTEYLIERIFFYVKLFNLGYI
jgi:hypothetical protein